MSNIVLKLEIDERRKQILALQKHRLELTKIYLPNESSAPIK